MMRRIIHTVAFLFIVAVISTSCKKDWTCQCEPQDNSNWSVQHFPISKQTKKDADIKCKEHNTKELECAIK